MNNSYIQPPVVPINYAFLEGGMEMRLKMMHFDHRKIVKMTAEQFEGYLNALVHEAYRAERDYSVGK